ncbi:hypothetical protein MMC09_003016 [Bachmanniomyces sp. S44760]|nr:hypothetical protein [Bachmanniomyces sp. S44760]
MEPPQSKRSRSSDSLGLASLQSGDDPASTISAAAKSAAYKNIGYETALNSMNSFLNDSEAKTVVEDLKFCKELLVANYPTPKESMFNDDRFENFLQMLHDRSEARIYLHLHPLVVPSAEILFAEGLTTQRDLIEGYNDAWTKAIPFFRPRPQPDHTVGFRISAFNQEERWKLDPILNVANYYAARDDIWFPFFTSEVKCGNGGLGIADRQNAHSMTTAISGVVELFRKVGRLMELHRRILGFSISHDNDAVRIFGHYPEINGGTTAYYRHEIVSFLFRGEQGKNKWTTYQFTRNVYEVFAPAHLKRIKSAVNQLPEPEVRPLSSSLDSDEYTPSNPEAYLAFNGAFPQGQGVFKKPLVPKAGAVIAVLRATNQRLEQRLEQLGKDLIQQQQEADQRAQQERKDVEQRYQQDRKDADQRAQQQLEQQRKDFMQIIASMSQHSQPSK